MPLQPFDLICPDTARSEPLSIVVSARIFGVPPGRYVLREFYCTELGCDCRRVLVQFFRTDDGSSSQVLAGVNFGWERPRFYRKWSSDPEMWREMAGATLERFCEQGPNAESFLDLFKYSIRQAAFVDGFRRHYALVKDMLERGKWTPTSF
ncbi:MAG: hypothetical protein ABSA83_23580 [Verrucomicrobiota bacterium]|jgi:hypothetical protein